MARDDAPHAVAASALGLALVAPILLLPMLTEGGAAPLAVAAVVALFVGAPAALAEWRAPPERHRAVAAGTAALGDLVAVGVIGAAAAPFVAEAGWFGLVLGPLGWGAAWGLSRHTGWMAVPAAVGVGIAGVAGGLALASEPAPYTLLMPQWRAWPAWIGPAVLAGTWLGGIGHAQWTLGVARRPGQVRAPWAGVGAGMLLGVGLLAHVAGRYEAALGRPGPDPLTAGVASLVLVAAAATVLARRGDPHPRLGLGVLATLWFAGPAVGTLAFGWSAALPVLMALGALAVLRRVPPAQRAPGIAGAVLLVASVGLGGAVAPQGTVNAATAGITLVAGFWLVATRAVLARGAP